MKKAIFWDFDGTLVKKNQSFAESLQHACRDMGVDIPLDDALFYCQKACSWYFPELPFPHRTGELWWEDLFKKMEILSEDLHLSDSDFSHLLNIFREYAIHYPYAVYEDAAETLGKCSALGFHNYILSSNFPELPLALSALGLDSLVEDCFLSSEIGYEKPLPELFAAARKGAGDPELAFMVGDNPLKDIVGARSAGMKGILVHCSMALPTAFSNCRELSEIPAVLNTL